MLLNQSDVSFLINISIQLSNQLIPIITYKTYFESLFMEVQGRLKADDLCPDKYVPVMEIVTNASSSNFYLKKFTSIEFNPNSALREKQKAPLIE